MADKNEEVQETEETPEPVDFNSSESRMTFLKSQLNDLLDGINNVYGQDLMEELLKRLEKTVEDFNEEVSGLLGRLKEGKILEPDEPEAVESPEDPEAGEAEDDDLSSEEQEAEDMDIIARMKARKKKSED
ncbi:MAG: hypothetical protein K9N38_09010 [Candidatus Marinimicrobia bacterium]|nr:hypothetical protein [Candidatus Neomarinimicrobiota bacterium]MCF7851306.1 hypothetical protein [Candidatus Neomarinimicrobiota bacterium]